MKQFTALEKAMLANIKKKVDAGKNPSASEKELWERFEASQKSPPNPFDIENTGLSIFFGVTVKTICTWANQGMPRESYGQYNLKKCFDWWCENINQGKEDSDSSITAIKKEYWQEKVIDQRRRNAVGAGLLMAKEEIIKGWSERAADLRQSLLALPSRMGPVLAMKPGDEVRGLIGAEVRRMLESFIRQGAYAEKKKRGRKKKNVSKPK